jgi:hypothetical protein
MYITGETINDLCAISIYERSYLNRFSNIKKYVKDVIFVNENNNLETILHNQNNIFFTKIDWIYYFINVILPLIKKPFILITHNGDQLSGNHLQILNHPLLLKWYGENMGLINNKTEGIPIGLENQMWNRTNFDIIEKNRFNNKNNLLYLNFSEKTNKNRKKIMELFLSKGFKKNNSLQWNDYMKELSTYKFAISPQGNGIDCHRTWECLYLGVIPIIEKSVPMSFFNELPILFISNYEEITEEYLNLVYEKFSNSKFNLEKLSTEYYKQSINNLIK